MGGSDLAIHDLERVPLASHTSEDGRSIESEIEGLGESRRGVGQEPDLQEKKRRQSRDKSTVGGFTYASLLSWV